MKDLTKKWGLSIAGMIGLAISIVMMIKANLGLTSINALMANLSEATGISMGIYNWTLGFVFIVFGMVITKKKFNWSALVSSFLIGSFIDLFFVVLSGSVLYESMMVRMAVFAFMTVLLAASVGLMIYGGVISPLEEYQFALQKILKTTVANAKLITDLSLVVFAVIVSLISHNGLGQIMPGTIVATLVTGKFIGITLELFNKANRQKASA